MSNVNNNPPLSAWVEHKPPCVVPIEDRFLMSAEDKKMLDLASRRNYSDNIIETDLPPEEQVKAWCSDVKLWDVHDRKWQRKNGRVKEMSRKAWKVFENKIKREARVSGGIAKYRSSAKAYTKFLKKVSRTTGFINFSLPMNIVLGKNGYEPVIADSFLSGINCPSDIKVKSNE